MNPLALLSWIGRHGTRGFALSIFLGLALPQFAAAARPLLGISIFVFVTLTFARIDVPALLSLLRRPAPLAVASVWLIAAPVLLALAAIALLGRENLDPGLVLGLAVFAAAPPIMSSPAIAMLLGIPPTLLMATLFVTTCLSPAISPWLAEFVAAMPVPLDLAVLIRRLLVIVGGALVAATVLRLVLGEARIRANRTAFDGVGVVMYFVFAIAAMDGVLEAAINEPRQVAFFLGLAFALAAAGFIASACLFPLSGADRFVLGYAAGQRNMGLLVAALGSATPKTTFLYFALAQFPIYLMPLLIKPFAARFRAPEIARGEGP